MGSIIIFNRGMKDVAGTKPQRLRLGDWYCEPPTWAKAMEMTAKALLFDVRYRDRLLKNLRSIRGFDAVSAGMHIPRKLESNLYLECNRSANGCLRTIRLLLEAASFPSGEALVPLLSVRSFVSFPAIPGLEWNVYLLETFLRRTSASFAYLSVSAAPRTACGAIVRRSAGFATVTDALARAVVEAGVSASEKEVGDFLIAQGYIQRRRGVEKDVAEAARRLTQTVSEGDVR